ncbi:MAG: hypothetical protein ACREFZ_04990 [Acetobacteraceae bacterium]
MVIQDAWLSVCPDFCPSYDRINKIEPVLPDVAQPLTKIAGARHHASSSDRARPGASSRIVIDAELRHVKWNLTDGRSVRFEHVLPDGTKADYVLCHRYGRSLAVVEAKRMARDPLLAPLVGRVKHLQTQQEGALAIADIATRGVHPRLLASV